MKVTHRQDMITATIQRGRRILNFYAWPGGKPKKIDYYNWVVDLPSDISKEYGKDHIRNYGFKSINEIEEYVKRFEDARIEDVEILDRTISHSW